MRIDNYYVVGLIYQYMRERLKPPVFGLDIAEFDHRCFAISACEQMIEVIKGGALLTSVMGVDALFHYQTEKLDNWACSVKSKGVSFFYSTQRDILLDLRDYIIGNLESEFPRSYPVRRYKKKKGDSK